MPLHDGAAWIGATLDSVAREPVDALDIVAIDSSTDEATAAIVARHAERLPIRLVRRPDLPGWPAKTNLGVEMAQADHVCMLHQDDLWRPGRVAAVRQWLAAAPAADLHLAPSVFVDARGRRLGDWTCPLPAGRPLDRAELLDRLLVQNFVSVPAPVVRRQAWLDCGGMDPELWYTADWDLWLKLAAAGTSVYHEAATTAFRVHGASLTVAGSRDTAAFRGQMEKVLDRHLDGAAPATRRGAERLGRASIAVNVALAAAARGEARGLATAAGTLLALGPRGLTRYLRHSRLHQRVSARVRDRLGARAR